MLFRLTRSGKNKAFKWLNWSIYGNFVNIKNVSRKKSRQPKIVFYSGAQKSNANSMTGKNRKQTDFLILKELPATKMKNETPASITSIDWLKARPRKLSVRIDGHATSISLEQAYIDILLQEAEKRELSFAGIVTLIDEARPAEINLSAALRLFALKLVQNSDF